MNKFYGISTPEEIAYTINLGVENLEINGNKYRHHTDYNDRIIISNVPSNLYLKKLTRYIPPVKIENKNKKIARFLINEINNLQKTEKYYSSRSPDGKIFQNNQCYFNSGDFFLHLWEKNIGKHFKVSSPVKMAYGYISRTLPKGISIDNKVIEIDNVVLHDWHVWNYYNNFLVDITIFKNGNIIPFKNEHLLWGKAEDHVFIKPPNGIDYYGIEFGDIFEFERSFKRDFEEKLNIIN